MDDAARPVQIAVLANRETRVARLFRERQTIGHRRSHVEGDDFLARAHDFARDAMAQVERVQNQVASGGCPALRNRREHKAQLLLRLRAVGDGVGFDADALQEPARREVQQPVERIKCQVKPAQRDGRGQRDLQRLLNRQPFRREFARHNA